MDQICLLLTLLIPLTKLHPLLIPLGLGVQTMEGFLLQNHTNFLLQILTVLLERVVHLPLPPLPLTQPMVLPWYPEVPNDLISLPIQTLWEFPQHPIPTDDLDLLDLEGILPFLPMDLHPLLPPPPPSPLGLQLRIILLDLLLPPPLLLTDSILPLVTIRTDLLFHLLVSMDLHLIPILMALVPVIIMDPPLLLIFHQLNKSLNFWEP